MYQRRPGYTGMFSSGVDGFQTLVPCGDSVLNCLWVLAAIYVILSSGTSWHKGHRLSVDFA